MTCRVPWPRCTKCTRTSLKFSAMRLSPQEPKRRYGLQGTSIQGTRLDKSKRREETQNLPSFDPLAIATTRIKEWNQESDKRRTSEELNPHFTGSMGLRKRGEKKQWNLHPFIQLVMGWAKVGKSEARFPNPNPLVGHHCHTRFSKEQNQANHMCAQEVHTYARMKKYQKQCYYITYT
jgi:hypothetical protein